MSVKEGSETVEGRKELNVGRSCFSDAEITAKSKPKDKQGPGKILEEGPNILTGCLFSVSRMKKKEKKIISLHYDFFHFISRITKYAFIEFL